MWRLKRLAEKTVELSDRGMLVDGNRTSIENEAKLAVADARKIAGEIAQLLPSLEERTAILQGQYLNLGGKLSIDV